MFRLVFKHIVGKYIKLHPYYSFELYWVDLMIESLTHLDFILNFFYVDPSKLELPNVLNRISIDLTKSNNVKIKKNFVYIKMKRYCFR